jgi:hypothetical protein
MTVCPGTSDGWCGARVLPAAEGPSPDRAPETSADRLSGSARRALASVTHRGLGPAEPSGASGLASHPVMSRSLELCS